MKFSVTKETISSIEWKVILYILYVFFVDSITVLMFIVHAMNKDISNEESYYILRELDSCSEHTQRTLSKSLGYSLGKVNFLLKKLTAKGFIKFENFVKSENKIKYRYVLTPHGLKERYKITKKFLVRKENEYKKIKKEIEDAKREMGRKYQ